MRHGSRASRPGVPGDRPAQPAAGRPRPRDRELRGDAPLPEPRGYDGPVAWLGLTVEPAAHREWIAARARAQFAAGLLEEARALRERFDPALPAFSAIGYREAWAVLDGRSTLEDAIELDTRRNVAFAKRQRTWFRAEPGIAWLDAATTLEPGRPSGRGAAPRRRLRRRPDTAGRA